MHSRFQLVNEILSLSQLLMLFIDFIHMKSQ